MTPFRTILLSILLTGLVSAGASAVTVPTTVVDNFIIVLCVVLAIVALFFGVRWWTKRATSDQKTAVEADVHRAAVATVQDAHKMLTAAHNAIMRLAAMLERKHTSSVSAANTAQAASSGQTGGGSTVPVGETATAPQPDPVPAAVALPTGDRFANTPNFATGTINPAPLPARVETQPKETSNMQPLTGDVLFKLLVVVATGQHDATLESQLGAEYNSYKNQYGVGGPWYWPELVSEAGRASGLPQFWPPVFARAGYVARGYGTVQGDKWVWDANLLGPFAAYYHP